ncbi:ABC transporter ATP-binding protein [Bacillus kwashiorkori]|uniref:ABC transporter ATP-binding protein n=1 Tax=Bacillus kwashiorkori TaxID=1522318 RepID=UPI00078657D3|nr:ABC transporter ATP-binding protein [Bacillus kwashiorkori]
MAQYALEVKSLTKTIGQKRIVDDVSFQINKGEVFGLLGPNGAGKTTIIRMIVKLINRTKGQVIVNGLDTDTSFSKAMNEIGAIVENPEFYKYLTGYQNLKHYARMAINPIPNDKINEIVQFVGLEDAINQKVKTYSLGMRQRLGIAQALLHSPTLLVLDEPTNGLDPQGIREFREHLRKLANEGISILISSHLLSEIELICDRYAIIEKGKIIQIASIHEQQDESENMVKQVQFTVSPLEDAMNVLETLPYVTNIERKNETQFSIHVTYYNIAKVNEALVKENVNIFEIQISRKTLEDRFIEITNNNQLEVKQ